MTSTVVYYASIIKPLRGPLPGQNPTQPGRTLGLFDVRGI